MGLFDSVLFTCPKCEGKVEFQSKAGDCHMATFHPSHVPVRVAMDINGKVEMCQCGTYLTARVPYPISSVAMSVDVT